MSKKLSQAEIDALIAGMIEGTVDPAALDAAMAASAADDDAEAAPAVVEAPPAEIDLGPISQAEVDATLRAAGKGSLVSAPDAAPMAAPGVGQMPEAAFMAPPVAAAPAPAPAPAPIFFGTSPAAAILLDLELVLTAELVRTRMPLDQLLGLQPGSVLELSRRANEPVDIIINGHQMMKAKVVTMGENYGVQVTETRLQQSA